LTQKADPPFVFAAAGFESYARYHESFNISGSTGTQDVQKGLQAAMTEIERVKRFGFTTPELERAKKNILTAYERQWNNRDKTESAVYADEYIRNFTAQEPIPGIDAEFAYVKEMLPGIQLSEVNALTDLYRNEKNTFAYITGLENDEKYKLPAVAAINSVIQNVEKDASIKAYEEKVIATNLLTSTPQAGKVTYLSKCVTGFNRTHFIQWSNRYVEVYRF